MQPRPEEEEYQDWMNFVAEAHPCSRCDGAGEFCGLYDEVEECWVCEGSGIDPEAQDPPWMTEDDE